MGTKLYDITDQAKFKMDITKYPYIGEIDTPLEIGEVLRIGDIYYLPGRVAGDKSYAGVEKIELNLNPEDKRYENGPICPYCGYKEIYSWELSDDDDNYECGQCGAIMSFERVVTVEYNSSPVKPPTIVEAKWA